ncbi:GNAT family N-acetyltransferase [Marixanthomonas ophiurae]|uniref:GNAT family N-acetyltransferase n=1 Tax=Marixanthomonas ophiurae TaxID=387659 RepID=UPI001313FE7A|nr:GNAT family protein [Marixanthomonas ophiurae]
MIKLEPFTKEDFQRLISWIDSERALIQFAGPIFSYPLTTKQLEDYVNKEGLKPKRIIDIETDKVIGHCELNFQNEYPRLSRILIGDKVYRGKGLGKHIVRLMIQRIQNKATVEKVDLRAFGWNENAVRLYKKEGFKIQHEATGQFKFHDESWTNLYMIKQI